MLDTGGYQHRPLGRLFLGRNPVSDGPLIVQSDKTLLLEVDHARADECRRAIAPFAELERAPEHVHTYRVTPLGLWNARAAGHDAEQVVDTLLAYSRYAVPHALLVDIAERMARYGRLQLTAHPVHGLVLHTNDRPVLEEVLRSKKVQPLVGARIDEDSVAVHPSERGHIKQVLLKLGWPAEDLAGYTPAKLKLLPSSKASEAQLAALDRASPFEGAHRQALWSRPSRHLPRGARPRSAPDPFRWLCRNRHRARSSRNRALAARR